MKILAVILLFLLSVLTATSKSLTAYFETYPEENIGIDSVFLTEGDILADMRRNAVRDIHATWLNRTVPYIIEDTYDHSQRMEIKLAMTEFEEKTCIRFVPRSDETDYIIIRSEMGCFSPVGRRGGQQLVSIGPGCDRKGTIMHELMHALGFWHEHSRPDRDSYITIAWDNIPEDHKSNFRKYTEEDIDTLGAPYDYGSIMHYKNNTFANDRFKPTIKSKFPLPDGVEMGQRIELSDTDILKVNRLYRCNITHCPDAGVPKIGYRKGDNFQVASAVHYNCSADYVLVGSRARYCMDIGQWTGNLPVCLPSYKGGKLHYCNFDRNNSCGWKQDKLDNQDWTFNNRDTPSVQTGPKEDRTMGTQEGYYIFLESSRPCEEGDAARLISPSFDFSGTKACLVFYYSMYGSTMGQLNVYQRVSGKNMKKFSQSGDQGQDWHMTAVVLDEYSSFEIVIEAIAGTSYKSDMAVDDVIVGSCDILSSLVNGDIQDTMSCGFNNGLCGWTQAKDDVFDWELMSGSTSTFNTGPNCDPSDCIKGQYLYTEASAPRVQGDTAIIQSPMLRGGSERCLAFSYHMFGDSMGTIKVYLSEFGSNKELLWTRSGDHGTDWIREQLDFVPKSLYQLVFEGSRGSSYRSDMAIDNVDVTVGNCADILTFDCNFDQDFCGWKNVKSPTDKFDWSRNKGATGTTGTGPSKDHTTGNGFYIYIETSLRFQGDFARIRSPTITDRNVGHCVEFWYHMYGTHIKSLSVLRESEEKGEEKSLWSVSNNQGDWWRKHSLFVGSIGQDFHIIFEAVAGGYRSDVAIDDVKIRAGTCFSYDDSSGSPQGRIYRQFPHKGYTRR
ncbi:MAM and LDL-receptor class A domain-containing protein 1 isoform X1 [Patella vulgata]|uniref:MAM and LDL-receptor class A domain-containing protein 1 isoform X1 n=1 Tax=Patella vulgata TaxID=6465 RepID=UPI00217F34B1|nr:MAM and LDL-receptor class A domain-containing protein 1 isoform X1 [Patella vulgata]